MYKNGKKADKNSSIVKLRIIGGFISMLAIVVLNSACTQYVASALNYHPLLGQPLLGILYEPFDWWRWMSRFYNFAPTAYNYAFVMFAFGILVILLTFVVVVGLKARSSRKHEGLHGTAHFATEDDIKKMGLLPRGDKPGTGVYCGAYHDPENGKTHYLRHDGPEHILALAPTRSGKGVGLVIPTLLSWPHSCLVLDRKGENYAMTSGWRKKHAKNVVLRFDPAKPGAGCRWNPLAEIQFGTRFQVSDAQSIALMVVDSDGKGIESDHFRSAAYELISGLMLHALYKQELIGRVPCLQDIAHMLTGVGDFAAPDTENDLADDPEGDPRALVGLFEEMRAVRLNNNDPAEREAQMIIVGVGTRMVNTPSRELGSIISTANNSLSLYRDPIVGENTAFSDFKIADLMDHENPVTLYYVSTPKTSKRLVPLTRLLVTMVSLNLADEMEFDNGRAKTAHKHRLLLLLDEFPTLGRIDVFEEALAYIAGYGIKAYLITQDVNQLYKAYTTQESIVSNCHIRIAYAPNKQDTAEWMSKMAGETTIIEENITTSGARFGFTLGQVSRSFQETKRPLMTPDEIMRLPGPVKDEDGEKILEAGDMLIFVAGNPAIHGRQILYFQDPVFAKRSRIPPVKTDVIHIEKAKATPAANDENNSGTKGKGGFVVG